MSRGLPVRDGVAGKWILPQPKNAYATGDFVPIPKISKGKVVPFGYKINEDNPHQLDPIPIELEALEKAKLYLKRYSSRLVANWLTKVTGRYISHAGLLQRVKSEQNNKSKASSYQSWAARYKKALELAEKFESRKGCRGIERAKETAAEADRRRNQAT